MRHTLVGAGLSLLGMLALTAKWRLPWGQALVGAVAATLVAAMVARLLPPLEGWAEGAAALGQAGLALTLGLGLVMVRFWRNPERIPPPSPGAILSAADGRVLYVRRVAGGEAPLVTKGRRSYRLDELTGTPLLPGGPAHVVGIEMSFLDVHVNRCPLSGRVRQVEHIGGRFLSLRRDEAPFVNERLTTVIENGALTVAVVQVASRLVRRIESYLSPGMTVSAGQRLGVIRLGSLVAVVIPQREGVAVTVRPGDRVTAGVTILARDANAEGSEEGDT